MYCVRIARGGSRKLAPYLQKSIKELSRLGQVDAALCDGAADLLILPRGAAAPDAQCGLLLAVGCPVPGAVCCGLSAADALTLSSIRGDRAMLSLQQELRRLDGHVLEVQEIPVTLRGLLEREPEAVLAAAAAGLLLGADPTAGIQLP